MDKRSAPVGVAVLAGIVECALSIAITAIYLSMIEIDDGLEALMFIPVMAAVSVPAALVAGWKGARSQWPIVAGMAAAATAFVAVLLLGANAGNSPDASLALSFSAIVFVLAGGGSCVGYVVGSIARRSFLRFLTTVGGVRRRNFARGDGYPDAPAAMRPPTSESTPTAPHNTTDSGALRSRGPSS